MTDYYWEIRDRDGQPIQRLLAITSRERERLKERGYSVERESFSRRVWSWLLSDEEDA